MIKELSYNLAEKRKKLGITIEQAVEKTKLCPSVIHDIEEGNLINVGATYVRGFIKIYAAFLGVNIPEGIFEEISAGQKLAKEQQKKNIFKKPAVKSAVLGEHSFPKVFQKARKKITLAAAAIAAVFILFIFAKFIVGNIFKEKKHVQVLPAQESSAIKPREVKKEVKKPAVVRSSNVTEDITASLKAKRDCFVRVKVDGNLLFEGILNRGSVEMWKGMQEIEFKISDGSAVYLEVNGDALPALTAMRKPIKSLKITHSGIAVDK